jgi:hypothetical protein
MFEITVDTDGPLFDGVAEAEVGRYLEHVITSLTETGVTMIKAYLPTQYMYLGHHGGTPEFNPVPANAGYLQRSIHSERQTSDRALITDTPVTYGPWIEGISTLNLIVWPHRRNPPARRFPGYHTFRVITQVLDGMVEDIALTELPPYLERMNEE